MRGARGEATLAGAHMITKEDLLAGGFRSYRWHDRFTGNIIYTKKIMRGNTLLYQIEAYIYFWSQFRSDMHDSTSVSGRFYLPNCPITGSGGFDFQPLLEPNATIDQVEALFARVYEQLGCCPDMHNNSD